MSKKTPRYKMKFTAWLFALATLATPSIAHEHHGGDYDVSVYRNYKDMPTSKRLNMHNLKKEVEAVFPQSYVTFDKLNGMFTSIYGKSYTMPGTTLEAKINYCFQHQLKALGVQQADWVKTGETRPGFAQFVNYKQQLHGRDVVFSRLSFRFTQNGAIEKIQMKNFGTPKTMAPTVSAAAAQTVATQNLNGVSIEKTTISNDWVWFPVPQKEGYDVVPAWEFEAMGHSDYLPVLLHGYVNALTGELLYRENQVKETVDLTVKGVVYKKDYLSPATVEPLADMLININSNNYYTDSVGYFSNASLSAPINATLNLNGRWANVYNHLVTVNKQPSYTVAVNTTGTTVIFDTTAPLNERLVNAYYHVTRVHDFMKTKFPSFTGMDFSLRTNVDTIGGTCNAYYTPANGNSINFYRESAGCNSFVYCGDIIYHEYGHGINNNFYKDAGATRMFNSALNEGTADIWGISITADPQLGKGSFKNGNVIRRYDLAPKVYPRDIQGESHADGEIIAGAWWDLSINLGSVDSMSELFSRTYYDVPDGASGTEGDVYHQVLISALQNDDNDNNLSNGTPHFMQIIQAFARHGIFLLMDATIDHTDISNPPANTPVAIQATVTVSEPQFLGGLKLFYKERTSNNWDSLVMTQGTVPSQFSATLPGFNKGAIVEYYFALMDYMNVANKYAPAHYAPDTTFTYNNILYQFGVGLNKVWGEDFEGTIDSTWQIGLATDDATTGNWIVASPIPSSSNGRPVQTGTDHTTGTASGKCLVTENALSAIAGANQADVDNGVTTVITPVISVAGLTDPIIEYFRWYGNDRGSNVENDMWEVSIKPYNASNWLRKVDYTNKSDYSWRRRIFRVSEYYANMTGIQLRFIAADKKDSNYPNNGQSTVEAAVDDIVLYDNGTTGINPAQMVRARIYPNPAQQEVNIVLNQRAKGTITFNDMTGKELMRIEMTDANTHYSFPTAPLPNGIYMVMIKSEHGTQLSKVNVAH